MKSMQVSFLGTQPSCPFRLIGIATMVLLLIPTELSGKMQSATNDNVSMFLGDWRGESTCILRASGCRDEDSEYHFSQRPGKPGWLSLRSDKVVDGKRVTMGTVDCNFDPSTRKIRCDLPAGAFHFELKGDRLEGDMTLQDGTLWRRLSLGKVN